MGGSIPRDLLSLSFPFLSVVPPAYPLLFLATVSSPSLSPCSLPPSLFPLSPSSSRENSRARTGCVFAVIILHMHVVTGQMR